MILPSSSHLPSRFWHIPWISRHYRPSLKKFGTAYAWKRKLYLIDASQKDTTSSTLVHHSRHQEGVVRLVQVPHRILLAIFGTISFSIFALKAFEAFRRGMNSATSLTSSQECYSNPSKDFIIQLQFLRTFGLRLPVELQYDSGRLSSSLALVGSSSTCASGCGCVFAESQEGFDFRGFSDKESRFLGLNCAVTISELASLGKPRRPR